MQVLPACQKLGTPTRLPYQQGRLPPRFKDAFFDVFLEENCSKTFEASGLVPIDAQVVLDRLEVRLRTPPEPLLPETPWQSKTPSNTHEFGFQSKLVRESSTQLPVTAQAGISQRVKGAELMLHQNALLVARIHKVEEQLAVLTKQKGRKRKRLQTGGTLEYSEGASQAVLAPSLTVQRARKVRSSSNQETA